MPSDSQVLLARILGVLGAASSVGCASRSTSDDLGASETGSEAGSGATETATTESPETEEGEGEEDTDEPVPDVNGDGDGDGDGDGEVECQELVVEWNIGFTPPPDCGPPDFLSSASVCFFPPDGFSCADEPFSDQCILDAYSCGFIEGGDQIGCGPITSVEGACCYVVWGECLVGRPWVVAGRARLAESTDSRMWTRPVEVEVDMLDPTTRAALAEVWTREGLAEHASIASFSRFSSQLLALGAPPALVHASARAAVDEIRHAQACFALASVYAGRPIGPTALDVRGGLDDAANPTSIALSLAAEGCIAETVSAILIAAARDRAGDPGLRTTLAQIAEDELEHALLAWEALAWMCRRSGPELASELLTVFCDAERHVGLGVTTPLADPLELRAHGYIPMEERRMIAARALADVVAPAARELLRESQAGIARADAIAGHE